MAWWEVFGWAGSVLVVISLMIPSVRKFRVINLIGSLIATIYNAYFGIWPYAVMNGAIVLINAYWLWRLHTDGESEKRGYSVVDVNPGDAMVRRFISRHGQDISGTHPLANAASLAETQTHLIMHDDEVVGLFAIRPHADGRGEVLVDYVTERFRDLTPGQYVYSNRGMFESLGVGTLEVPSGATTDTAYFRKQGFTNVDGKLTRSL